MSPKNTRARVLPANHTLSAEESNGRLNLLSQIDRSSVLRKMFKTASTDMVRPPFKMNGITYCIGDIVKFHHDNPTAELPNAWLGLLVDYSAGNPRATPTSKVIHPGEGKTVDLVAICWFYSQSDVEDLVNGRIDLHPDIVYKGKTRGKIQFEAQFFDADNYDNVRFPCNEVEWTLVDGLLGLASPDEVGDGMDSNRAVTVPFRGPWLGVQHLVLDVKATAKRKAYEKEVHEVSIITEPNVGLPDGFVEEIKEEVKEDE